MRISTTLPSLLAFVSASPCWVSAGPIAANSPGDSRLSQRGMEDHCRNVPHFYDDYDHYKCWEKARGQPNYSASPGTAQDCLDLANRLEKNDDAGWQLHLGNSRQIAVWKSCSFNVRRHHEDIMKIGGTDVVDILRDAVKAWCPDSYEIREVDGKLKMAPKIDDSFTQCPMLGHGIVNECRTVTNGRSTVDWAIGQPATSTGSFTNGGDIQGRHDKLPDCVPGDH